MVSSTATICATLFTMPHASSNSSLFFTNKFSKVNNTFTPKLRNKNIPANEKHSLQYLCTSLSTPRLGPQSQNHTLSFEVATSSDVVVADKVNWLASEFNSLSEPIDRVKRLLHYAALLSPLDESERVPEKRVAGCATQVWLVSEMDKCGKMRFRADSDSEISKGFCWCLVWMLDGAEPEEVLMVQKQDLVDINVGLNLKARSRVNTWHNVLFGMQKATKDLVLEMEGKPFPSLLVTPDDIPPKGKFSGIQW